MTRLIRPSGHCATRTSDGAMRARAGPQPSTAAVQVPASPVERSIAWLIPRLRIEGWHKFSTLVVCHQLLHPIALNFAVEHWQQWSE